MKKILLILVGLIVVGLIGLSFFKIPAPSVEVRQSVTLQTN